MKETPLLELMLVTKQRAKILGEVTQRITTILLEITPQGTLLMKLQYVSKVTRYLLKTRAAIRCSVEIVTRIRMKNAMMAICHQMTVAMNNVK